MRISSKVALVSAAALAIVLILVLSVVLLTARQVALQESQQFGIEVSRQMSGLLALTVQVGAGRAERARQQWRAQQAALADSLAHARQSDAGPTLQTLHMLVVELKPMFTDFEYQPPSGDPALDQRRADLLMDRLLAQVYEAIEAHTSWSQSLATTQASLQRDWRRFFPVMATSMLALVGILAWTIWRQILRPLDKLQAVAARIQAGDLAARTNSQAQDELGITARAIDGLASALVDDQQRLRLILDHVPALIARIGRDGRYTMVNRVFREWITDAAPDPEGRTLDDVHGVAELALMRPLLNRALTGDPASFEVEWQLGTAPRNVLVHFVPARGEGGRVDGVYMMASDVTAARRAELRLRRMMDSSPLAIAIRAPGGKLLYANLAWWDIGGFLPQEPAVAARTADLHPGDAPALMAALQAVQRDPQSRQVLAFRFQRPDGRQIWIQVHLTGAAFDHGDQATLTMLEDVTERHQAAAELAEKSAALERSNEDLARFAYVASHDLQEPLRMVNSFGQLLQRRHLDKFDGEAREFLDFMVDGSQRAQAMIRDLLTLARVDSQARPLVRVSLETALVSAMTQVQSRVAAAGAAVTHDPLPDVLGDPRQLVQLLVNLIDNAVKYRGTTPPCVHISAQQSGDHWRIGVQDNGIGIESKFFDRIFVMFQRLHLRAKHPGTGIGLAICKRVVERHGGRIWVESTAGAGATFFFTLAAVGAEGAS